ncbi:MAG: ATPase, T2SS/T4P/T4SS family [Candidatus Nezhaarchaeota archaeon]|nr:ATPase, T2SS/T4P/T4SS family [Candidatus Nezhaarchaeota archaeon]
MEKCEVSCRSTLAARSKHLLLKCPIELGGDLANSEYCRGRVVFLLSRRGAEGIVVASAGLKRTYVGEPLELLREYAEAISGAKWRVLDEGLLRSCSRSPSCFEARRRFLQVLFSLRPPLGKIYGDPLGALLCIRAELSKISAIERQARDCDVCLSNYKDTLMKLEKALKRTKLYKSLEKAYKEVKVVEAAYARVLKASRIEALPCRDKSGEEIEAGELLDSYEVPPFQIRIMYLNPVERLYVPSTILKTWERSLLSEVVRRARAASSYVYGLIDRRLSILMGLKRKEVKGLLKQLWAEGGEELEYSSLVDVATYKLLGLQKIAPFLLDEQVEEFFLDKPSTYVYLIHTRWGRCRSSIRLGESDVERIITHLKIESGKSLDYENPSLKCEIITEQFHVRASVDIPPLSSDGASLDFRKLRKKLWTLPELVDNRTLSSELAAYLIFCLFRRRNLTIVGEPNTGKTTLANALDLCTPPHWRKIYVEDVVESIPQRDLGKHQVRLRVTPLESTPLRTSKSLEVLKLLHRSPDFVILSEIQTPEHTKALFQALGAGLRGIQTCHASTIEGLLRRWVLHHGIHPTNILDLDALVLMKTVCQEGRELRRVVKVCEIAAAEGGYKVIEVFSWSPRAELFRAVDLYEAPTVMKVREFENLSRTKFTEELLEYQKAIEELATSKAGIREVASRFTQLFYRYVA